MQVTTTFVSMTYEEARREFFLQKKHEAERKLQYNQKRLKRASGHKAVHLCEICSNLGSEICYYNDALKAFTVVMDRTERSVDYDRQTDCLHTEP